MPLPIEDYAIIGDTHTAALVGRDGSIDWLCWPRFDSDACFAALLGEDEHGRWRLAPIEPVRSVRRRYRSDTLVLETDFETSDGVVRVTDFMPPRGREPDLIRIVSGLHGRVTMRMELAIRFEYGNRIPWLQHNQHGVSALAGPDAVWFHGETDARIERGTILSELSVAKGESAAFRLEWHPSHEATPSRPLDVRRALEETCSWWREWCGRCRYDGPWRDEVVRSLITLKALTYSPTGGLVAAPTTSLPERFGGIRNWDYRFCWLRDATFTLLALMDAGYLDEARAWRAWLIRAIAGEPDELLIAYGLGGERRLHEIELDWLPGYQGSRPVRVGNLAAAQLQLDVYGEVMDCLHHSREHGVALDANVWPIQRDLIRVLASRWQEPDEGIWEVRGPRQHFTHSKVMAWVAVDRAIRDAQKHGFEGPIADWQRLRARIHDEVCRRGYDRHQASFVQSYDSTALDASSLLIPLVGFLPPTDERVRATVAAIQRGLVRDGLVYRYDSRLGHDGLPSGEGAFLACSFWLADNLILMGQRERALELFERLLALRNDVGLLSEQYDPGAGRLAGNFPQAFSHVALLDTAFNLSRQPGPARQRPRD